MTELALMEVEQTVLSQPERRELGELEERMEQGQFLVRRGMLQCAEALREIHDRKLYREYGTFADYCEKRWHITDRHARRLLNASSVVIDLKSGPIGPLLEPENECQLRPLVELGAEERQAVWQLVHAINDNEPVTGKRVAAVVEVWREAVVAAGQANMSPDEICAYVRRKLKGASTGPAEVDLPSPAEGKYNVIYADPPWRYEGGTTTPDRNIEHHYPTMTLDDICALGAMVKDIADKNCVLFLWSTSPKLAEAMRVIEAWGFNYRTNAAWIKVGSLGLGNYWRMNHELLLTAIKGNPGCPEPKFRPHSVVEERKRRHSQKPDKFYDIIEAMYPNAVRIELFARNKREGWAAWGNEVTA